MEDYNDPSVFEELIGIDEYYGTPTIKRELYDNLHKITSLDLQKRVLQIDNTLYKELFSDRQMPLAIDKYMIEETNLCNLFDNMYYKSSFVTFENMSCIL